MEDEFLHWYLENETRFHQGHLDEKEIAYSAWLEGQKAGQHETIVMRDKKPIPQKIKEIAEEDKTKWLRKAKVCKAVRKREYEPWSLLHVLEKLVESAHILLQEKSYDGHGYEAIDIAKREAEALIKEIRA